jgi:hypothetical protein
MTTKVKEQARREKDLKTFSNVYLKTLYQRMTGGRVKKPGTIKSYMHTAKDFLEFTGKTDEISPGDVDKYMAACRSNGISERTLRTRMFQIKKLVEANQLFKWEYTKDDTPSFQEENSVTSTLTLEQLTQLIMAQAKYSPAERFYLAISTTFACRSEAMSQIKKRNYDEETITIPGVKHGRTIKHLIPPVLRPIFADYTAKAHTGQAQTNTFHRIAEKAGLELPKAKTAQGIGWHSSRRGVTSLAEYFIPLCKGPDGKPLPQSVWADFTGWTKEAKGRNFMGSSMAGHYTHSEAMNKDPYWLDRCIYAGHPLLKVWKEALKKVKKAKPVSEE